jgi:hypothetical protein
VLCGYFLFVTNWVTSLGSECEVAIFADLLFYPNVFGVPKWFTALPRSRDQSQGRIDQVLNEVALPSAYHGRFACVTFKPVDRVKSQPSARVQACASV